MSGMEGILPLGMVLGLSGTKTQALGNARGREWGAELGLSVPTLRCSYRAQARLVPKCALFFPYSNSHSRIHKLHGLEEYASAEARITFQCKKFDEVSV